MVSARRIQKPKGRREASREVMALSARLPCRIKVCLPLNGAFSSLTVVQNQDQPVSKLISSPSIQRWLSTKDSERIGTVEQAAHDYPQRLQLRDGQVSLPRTSNPYPESKRKVKGMTSYHAPIIPPSTPKISTSSVLSPSKPH